MDYITEIHILEETTAEDKALIESQLNGGTLRLPIFPVPNMPVGLPNGMVIMIVRVLPLAQSDNTPHAIAVVKPSK